MPAVRQTSFAGGELSPLLYGRPDLAKYAVGLKRCYNFFITRAGQAVSRPGSVFVARTKATNAAAGAGDYDGPVRLVPFVFSNASTEANYVLEFGHQYVRFYKDGAQVQSSPGVPLETATPYNYADLPYLKFTQSGDVLTVTHSGYAPREFRHLQDGSGDHWPQSQFEFTPTSAASMNSAAFSFGTAGTPDADHPAAYWYWALGIVWQDSHGVVRETTPLKAIPLTIWGGFLVPSPTPVPLYGDMPLDVTVSAATTPSTVLGYRVYRGKGPTGPFGLIASHKGSGNWTFTDYGNLPDYSQPPRVGTNPFVSGASPAGFYTPLGGTSGTDFPTCVTYFEDRLAFARTPSRPGGLFFSASGDYGNFDELLFPNDAMQANFDLAARTHEEIRALVPLSKLLVFTNSSIWAVSGSGGPLAYNSIDAKVQAETGVNWVEPAVVDGAVLYARSKGDGLGALSFDLRSSSFQSFSVCTLADHLFRGAYAERKYVVDLDYQESPFGLLWAAVLPGGPVPGPAARGYSTSTLLSLTFDRNEQVYAWAQHETPFGVVESVCCVSEDDEDAVYLSVARTYQPTGETRRYIERLSSRKLRNLGTGFSQQPVCLDSAATHHYDFPGGTSITGLGHLEGMSVMAVGDGVVHGPLEVVGGAVTLPEAHYNVCAGLAYNCELETLDPIVPGAETRLVQKQVTRVVVEVADSNSFEVGPDFNNLRPWRSRRVADSYGALGIHSEAAEVSVKGGWGPDGHVCIRQSSPLPLTILGITREVEVADR